MVARMTRPHLSGQSYVDSLSDAELIEHAAARLSVPKQEAADSFVLHAPLELLARAELLRFASPEGRSQIRAVIASLADEYDDAAASLMRQPLPLPLTFEGGVDPAAAVDELIKAITAGDLDRTDDAALLTAAVVETADLAGALAGFVLPKLAAAAHGSIFLSLLPRVAPTSSPARSMLRGLARELARQPNWELTWFHDARWSTPSDQELLANLLAPPSPGPLASNFIYPTMDLTERSGLCAALLSCVAPEPDAASLAATSRTLLRVAGWSMLQEPLTHAPYGWTHCLTMTQAALALAGIGANAAPIAATYVLGFRSTLGVVSLDPAWEPDHPDHPATKDSTLNVICNGPPDDAAAAAWHAPRSERHLIRCALADRAGAHHDAHLAKYALACFDAADADPSAEPLYLAALARLHAWWKHSSP